MSRLYEYIGQHKNDETIILVTGENVFYYYGRVMTSDHWETGHYSNKWIKHLFIPYEQKDNHGKEEISCSKK